MEAKNYTTEEIRKLAPKYRGKPENFDPSKVGKPKTEKPKKKMAQTLSPPRQIDATEKPTPQKNYPLREDSVFVIDTSCRELDVSDEFTSSFARQPDLVEEVHSAIGPDDIDE
ncbi:hypothetical protein EVAR_10319_1 [Eumeta japonica]|uniref:Uncharacterized protein n=1 Tax=Eumeta variegata TaxID=151549 RepID=A0A4C1TDR6_EUMVA|nr:hypothetical protein EVAR_10319_1 [Eumeta japonica]